MKTKHLREAQLDRIVTSLEHPPHMLGNAHYSMSWHWAGPIIERERISLIFTKVRDDGHPVWQCGDHRAVTPLIAAMRHYVSLRLGDEIPEEIL